nr:hypothetical protein [Nitrosomonas sp.]
IAKRAGSAVDEANLQIDTALSKLDEAGVNIDTDKLRIKLQEKIQDLSQDSSQIDIANLLKKELDNIDLSTEARSSIDLGIKDAEQIKRGYNRKAGNWMDPEKGQAGKEMYQTYRGAVEDAAHAADPATAQLFEEGKKSFGLLRPIEEAAERRANTTAQSPVGGLLDMASGGAGAFAAGPIAGAATAIGRRLVAPRVSSSVAVTADKVSKMLLKTPRMQAMASENPKAFGALVNSLTSKLESSGQLQKAAGNNDQANIMDRISQDPRGMDMIQNPKLKEQLKKKNFNQSIEPKQAQNQFIDEN